MRPLLLTEFHDLLFCTFLGGLKLSLTVPSPVGGGIEVA
jgi:hypothetical protein